MKKILKSFLVLLIFIVYFGSIGYSRVNNVVVEPKGIFAEIDVKKSNEAVKILKSSNNKSKKEIINTILESPSDYNPTVLYVLSNELFKSGEKDKGAFWFYVGQLRAAIDANICADATARQEVSVLNQEFGKIINSYTIPKVDLLEKIVLEVIDYVRKNNENYDRRWINLYGMWALEYSLDDNKNKDLQLSLPKEEWAGIKENTINDYYQGFKEALESLKGQ